MNKGLEALERLKMFPIYQETKRFPQQFRDKESVDIDLSIIEKELKQAQKDKEMLDIFKNALTIKHTCVLPEEKDHSKDAFVCAVKYLYEITQNDLDEKLRKSLREWVLKNAFPEELKRLRELEKAFDTLSKEDEKTKKLLSLEIEKNRALNEILALHDKWLGYQMSDFEFFTLLSEIKDKYGLEV